MQMPVNTFKQALKERRRQLGLWIGLADSYAAELFASTGYDWLLIDAEHAPNDPRSVLRQLQAMAAYQVHPIVRPVHGSVELVKQYLDLGAQTLLIPMVETAEQAAHMVSATRYPTRGIRGVGSAIARASRWNQIEGYLHGSDEQMCVLVQIESVAALERVESIASVPGVDGVFFGPADLSASMGLLGRPMDSAVQAAILEGMAAVARAGKPSGCLCSNRDFALRCLAAGATFVAVGVDTSLLVKAASDLLAAFKEPLPAAEGPGRDRPGQDRPGY